jgi:glycosyltransferase involved in cell wall biosynthesis
MAGEFAASSSEGYAIGVATVWPWPVRDGVTSKSGNLFANLPLRIELIAQGPSSNTPPNIGPHVQEVVAVSRRSYWLSILKALIAGTLVVPPSLNQRRVMPVIRAQLSRGRPDFVHLDTMSTAHLIVPIRSALKAMGYDSPIVLSINDSYSFLAKDALQELPWIARKFKLAHIRRVERRLLPLASTVHVVNNVDQTWLAKTVPKASVRVVPLGRPSLPPLRAHGTDSDAGEYDVILFSARPGLVPFLTEFVSIDRTKGLRIALLGSNPDPVVLSLLSEVGGQYLGFVEDLAPTLARARLLIAPSQQEAGLSNKAMQAMALGVAVAGGRCLETLPGVTAGVHCLIERSTPTLALNILGLLDDPERLARIAHSGRELIAGLPEWPAAARTYVESVSHQCQ